jgi:hypothetical protein
LGEHAATKQDGDWGGIALGIFGLTARDGLHGESMPENDRDAGIGAEVNEPGLGAQTFDRDAKTLSIRGNGCQKGRRGCLHVAG